MQPREMKVKLVSKVSSTHRNEREPGARMFKKEEMQKTSCINVTWVEAKKNSRIRDPCSTQRHFAAMRGLYNWKGPFNG